jgi:hypothetical protein
MMSFSLVGRIWKDSTNVNTGEEKLRAFVITTAVTPLMAKIHNNQGTYAIDTG